MRSAETVLTAKTNERLEDLIPRLNRVSGLPVVDANSRVIGVISRKVSEQSRNAILVDTVSQAACHWWRYPSAAFRKQQHKAACL